jgi:ankyrin repeat protein
MFDRAIKKLLIAAEQGDLDSIKRYIEIDAVNVNANLKQGLQLSISKVPAGTSALMVAAMHAKLEVFNYLAARPGVMLGLVNKEDKSALTYALTTTVPFVAEELDQIASSLLRGGVTAYVPATVRYLNTDTNKNNASLFFAASKGLTATTGLLLDKGMPLDTVSTIQEKYLIKNWSGDAKQVTALYQAIIGKHAAIVTQILSKIKDTNKETCTTIHLDLAAQTSSFAVIKAIYEFFKNRGEKISLNMVLDYVLRRGTTKYSQGYQGIVTDYDFSVAKDFLDYLPAEDRSRTLVKLEKTVDNYSNEHYRDGQGLVFVAAKNGRVDCLEYLKSLGLDMTQRDNDGNTVMVIAAREGHLALVQKIAEWDPNSANVDYSGYSTNSNAESPLCAAIGVNHGEPAYNEEVALFLLPLTTDINALNTNHKITALHKACRFASLVLVQKMLEKGASASVLSASWPYADAEGTCSALTSAIIGGNLDLVPALVANMELNNAAEIKSIVSQEFKISTREYHYRATQTELKTNNLVQACASTSVRATDEHKAAAVALLAKYIDVNQMAINADQTEDFDARFVNKPPIFHAVDTKSPQTVAQLILAGAKLDQDDLVTFYDTKKRKQDILSERDTIHVSLITLAALRNDAATLGVLLNTDKLSAEQKKILVNQRIDVPNQCTVLMLLAVNKEVNSEVIRLLIGAGADLTLFSNDGYTAYDYAVEAKNHKVSKLLKVPSLGMKLFFSGVGNGCNLCGLEIVVRRKSTKPVI